MRGAIPVVPQTTTMLTVSWRPHCGHALAPGVMPKADDGLIDEQVIVTS